MPCHVVPANPPTEKWGERSVIRSNRPPTASVIYQISAHVAAISAVNRACTDVSILIDTIAKDASSAGLESIGDCDGANALGKQKSTCPIAGREDFWNFSADQDTFRTPLQKEVYLWRAGILSMVPPSIYLALQRSSGSSRRFVGRNISWSISACRAVPGLVLRISTKKERDPDVDH